jgi:hypothetical protein
MAGIEWVILVTVSALLRSKTMVTVKHEMPVITKRAMLTKEG